MYLSKHINVCWNTMGRPRQPTHAAGLCSNGAGAVVIISSAGGIEALCSLLGGLPKSFPIPIFVAQHLQRRAHSRLPEILEWSTGYPARWVISGEIPAAGVAHVVRPGYSAQIGMHGFVTAALPDTAVSWFASVDILLESAAEAYGAAAVGIVLSGMLPAGIHGLRAIRAKDGIMMAQSIRSSTHAEMPMAAHDQGMADIVFPPAKMAEALLALAESRAGIPAH